MARKPAGRTAVCGTVMLALVQCAAGQVWTAQVLHEPEWIESTLYGLDEGQAVGYFRRGGGTCHSGVHPVIWHSGGYTVLVDECGWAVGTAYGINVGRQVGTRDARATIWSSNPHDRVDLHPPGAYRSRALAIRGDQQVGSMSFAAGMGVRASLWNGSAESWVLLHPAWANWSVAYGTDGERQGGVVGYPLMGEWAALWDGSAESITILNPGEGWTSVIYGMAPGQQAGKVALGIDRAAVWSGTAASMRMLHPPGMPGTSQIRATTGRVQAGSAQAVGFPRAAVWFDTPESYVDLHGLLPGGYGYSVAMAVWEGQGRVRVGGYAGHSASSRNHAVLWVLEDPNACWANCDTSTGEPRLTVDDFTCFINEFSAGLALPQAQQVLHYANCDNSTRPPVLNVDDFTCFVDAFARGCP